MKTTLCTDITVEQICKGFVYNELEGKGLFGLSGKTCNPAGIPKKLFICKTKNGRSGYKVCIEWLSSGTDIF